MKRFGFFALGAAAALALTALTLLPIEARATDSRGCKNFVLASPTAPALAADDTELPVYLEPVITARSSNDRHYIGNQQNKGKPTRLSVADIFIVITADERHVRFQGTDRGVSPIES